VGESAEVRRVASTSKEAPAHGSLVIGAKVLEGERTYLSSSSSESSSSEGPTPHTGLPLEDLLRRGFEDESPPEAVVAAKAVAPISVVAPARGSTSGVTRELSARGPLDRLKSYLQVVRLM
jgi:hypothetical protein